MHKIVHTFWTTMWYKSDTVRETSTNIVALNIYVIIKINIQQQCHNCPIRSKYSRHPCNKANYFVSLLVLISHHENACTLFQKFLYTCCTFKNAEQFDQHVTENNPTSLQLPRSSLMVKHHFFSYKDGMTLSLKLGIIIYSRVCNCTFIQCLLKCFDNHIQW